MRYPVQLISDLGGGSRRRQCGSSLDETWNGGDSASGRTTPARDLELCAPLFLGAATATARDGGSNSTAWAARRRQQLAIWISVRRQRRGLLGSLVGFS
ncbi:hypothetical protein HAX54_045215 [Datura stramonium]|uniref:Uncharacterized protein n=1 Tax=Datura stramonium TaxID=4076 RepID=A0ABS8RHN1_DATST|nr:hypothetical protein [Datura stramonium]